MRGAVPPLPQYAFMAWCFKLGIKVVFVGNASCYMISAVVDMGFEMSLSLI